jgi:hypothetical protein
LSRPRFAHVCLLAACGFGLLTPRLALAQNPAAAEALFEQARAAMAAGSYDIACARFRDSDKLDPAVGTRFNLADCEERRGRVATAWSLFRGVLSELAQDDDRRPIAEGRARALQPRLPYLRMKRDADTPPGVRVRIDGVELGEGSFDVALPMDPGTHELRLLPAEGGEGQRSTFALREGEHSDMPIRYTATPPIVLEEDPAADLAAPRPASEQQRKWAYVAGGIGGAGIAVGAVTGIVTINKKSTANANCSDDRRVCNQAGIAANESGKTYGTLSALGFGVGLIGLAAGTYLWLSEPAEPAEPSTVRQAKAAHPSIPLDRGVRVSAELTCERGAGFVALAGSF